MPLTITIEAFGETEMERTLLRWDERVRNPLPVWKDIHEDFMDIERYQFESQGELSGGWQPLADSTVERKAIQGFDTRIMFRTGALFESLTESGDEQHVFHPLASSLEMGSTVDYGKYHHSRDPRQHLPRRPLIVLTTGVKTAWVKKLQRWIVSGQI